jgi:hypothetical protein
MRKSVYVRDEISHCGVGADVGTLLPIKIAPNINLTIDCPANKTRTVIPEAIIIGYIILYFVMDRGLKRDGTTETNRGMANAPSNRIVTTATVGWERDTAIEEIINRYLNLGICLASKIKLIIVKYMTIANGSSINFTSNR